MHDNDALWEVYQAIIFKQSACIEILVETNQPTDRPTDQDIEFKMVRC